MDSKSSTTSLKYYNRNTIDSIVTIALGHCTVVATHQIFTKRPNTFHRSRLLIHASSRRSSIMSQSIDIVRLQSFLCYVYNHNVQFQLLPTNKKKD